MTATVNRQILLAEKPSGRLGLEHFRLVEGDVPEPGPGEALLRVRLLSLDAANRAWMQGATYRAAVDAGSVMAGGAIAEVVRSETPELSPGDLVYAGTGWQDYAVLPGKLVTKLARIEPMSHLLSVYGIAGLTAYFGLLRVGRLKAGETVVVSAAAGAVGSLAGQIARLKGCRVVGIAGGAEKCRWLEEELGFDAAVDYKSSDFAERLKLAAPDGIDLYFDNVGGAVLEAALFQMKLHGRIVCCGAVSQYDAAPATSGPRGVPGQIVVRRLTLQGFVVWDFDAERDAALTDLRAWVEAGSLKVQEDILDGIEQAPRALIGLLAGDNRGKRMVRVA